MKILLSDTGKRYNREWIFRHLTYEFHPGNAYAITGNNGSGKSTLLQVIAGAIQHSEGTISYEHNGEQVAADQAFQQLAIAAPYLELMEEMTLEEFFTFHFSFKNILPGQSISSIINIIGLTHAVQKQIRYYSSGMKQRVKLAQAIFSDVPVVLLDEPCTNLDQDGIELYQRLVEHHCKDRLLIISSNDQQEYGFCEFVLPIGRYK